MSPGIAQVPPLAVVELVAPVVLDCDDDDVVPPVPALVLQPPLAAPQIRIDTTREAVTGVRNEKGAMFLIRVSGIFRPQNQ
jgi:hypothetical protein